MPTIVLALAGSGCATARAPGAARVQNVIESANPACSFERESRIALGGMKLAVVKALVRLSGESDEAGALAHIRYVEVVGYRNVAPSLCQEQSWAEWLRVEMTQSGWRPVVVERDGSQSSQTFAHGNENGEIDGLFVVDFDGNELEVVRIDGRMDRLLAEALAEDADPSGTILASR